MLLSLVKINNAKKPLIVKAKVRGGYKQPGVVEKEIIDIICCKSIPAETKLKSSSRWLQAGHDV